MLDKTLVGGKDPMAFLFSGAKTGYLAEWNPRTLRKRLPGSEAALNDGLGLLCFVVAVLASPFKSKIQLGAENATL